jgi:hypothetical protein
MRPNKILFKVWFPSYNFFGFLKRAVNMKKEAKINSTIYGIFDGHFDYEIAANSFSYFTTQPSAPHSLRISIALFRFCLAFD